MSLETKNVLGTNDNLQLPVGMLLILEGRRPKSLPRAFDSKGER
jgi:hypothetical protein